MTARTQMWLASALVGISASAFSLLRLWLGNQQAITQNLWAEDGLFPLCIRKAGVFTCLADPFAGYFLFIPRVLAWPVAALPWAMWATAANVIAAVLAGLVAALVVLILRGAGIGWYATVLLALLPVLAPMSGLEAINSIGSSYMLLLYSGVLLVLFRPDRGRAWTMFSSVFLLITALTIPSAVVILAVVIIQVVRRAIRPATAASWAGALGIGLAVQAYVALTATTQRPVQLTGESVSAWADSVPVSLLTYWPGLSIGEYSFFTNFTLGPSTLSGWLFVAIIAGLGLWRVSKGWRDKDHASTAVGLLLLSGLAMGLIPSAIGYTNNRYFVVPLLLWGAALLVWLDPVIRRTRPWVLALVTAIIAIVWWPSMPASEFRSTPAPPWQDEVARVEAKCLSDPAFIDRPIFSPFWPPNWGDGLDEPTHPNLPCTTVYRWLP